MERTIRGCLAGTLLTELSPGPAESTPAYFALASSEALVQSGPSSWSGAPGTERLCSFKAINDRGVQSKAGSSP